MDEAVAASDDVLPPDSNPAPVRSEADGHNAPLCLHCGTGMRPLDRTQYICYRCGRTSGCS